MKKVLFGLLMAVLALSFVACGGKNGNNDSSKIVGTWKLEDIYGPLFLTFNEDNTCTSEVIYEWNGRQEPYQQHFLYSYDNSSNILKFGAKDEIGNEQWGIELLTLEWIDSDHFYLIVSEGTPREEKVGPFSRAK